MKEKLMSMLEVLAEKLGTTTELLWSVLVKQAGIEAQIWMMWIIVWISVFGSMAIVGIIVAFAAKKQREADWGCWFILTFIAFALGIIVVVGCYSQVLTLSQNPEYWALNEILHSIR